MGDSKTDRTVDAVWRRRRLGPVASLRAQSAVAVSPAYGPVAGFEIVENLISEPSLKAYHLLAAVRADLLEKLGRLDEARAEYERAAGLTKDGKERQLLQERAERVPPQALLVLRRLQNPSTFLLVETAGRAAVVAAPHLRVGHLVAQHRLEERSWVARSVDVGHYLYAAAATNSANVIFRHVSAHCIGGITRVAEVIPAT